MVNCIFFYRFEQEISREFMKSSSSSSSSRPMFVPSQVKQFNAYNTASTNKMMTRPPLPMLHPHHPHHHHHNHNHPVPSFNPTFQQVTAVAMIEKSPVILSSAPKLYSRPNVPTAEVPPNTSVYANTTASTTPTSSASSILPGPSIGANFDMNALQFEVPTKAPKKSKTEKTQQNLNAEDIIKAAKASSALQSFGNKDKRKVDKKTVRQAGGCKLN